MSKPVSRRDRILRVVLATVALLGVALVLYPIAARWNTDMRTRGELRAYVKHVQELEPLARQKAAAAATNYNRGLVSGRLTDPFSAAAAGEAPPVARSYQEQLDLLPGGVMGRVTVPSVGIDLPIYHGTSDAVLAKGVGHLYGSSLPVGGVGTHAVLVGHSGIPEASLFTKLPEVAMGATIYVDALGADLAYRVDRIYEILPSEVSSLRVVPGRDLISLITCVPIGVNSHRLVVQAVRIPLDREAWKVDAEKPLEPPFPWWMVAGGCAIVLWLGVLWRERAGVSLRDPDPESESGPDGMESSGG